MFELQDDEELIYLFVDRSDNASKHEKQHFQIEANCHYLYHNALKANESGSIQLGFDLQEQARQI
jgi:hypothetical protein